MVGIIISLIVGYFMGMISCLWQVVKMEERENDRIKNILERKK